MRSVLGQQMGMHVPHFIFMTLFNLLSEPGGARPSLIDLRIDSSVRTIQLLLSVWLSASLFLSLCLLLYTFMILICLFVALRSCSATFSPLSDLSLGIFIPLCPSGSLCFLPPYFFMRTIECKKGFKPLKPL